MLDGLLKSIKKKKLVENRDFAGVDKLQLVGVGKFKSVLEATLVQSLHKGVADALGEVERGLKDTGVEFVPKFKDKMKSNYAGEEYDTLKDVLAFWSTKVPVQKYLMKYYVRQAFTISGVHRDRLLSQAQIILQKGIKNHASYTQVANELTTLFQPYLETAGAIDAGLANPYRINNIVRTNMSEAYNSGRWDLFHDPEVIGFIKAFEYSAVIDDRTTPFCEDWNEEVLRADDPQLNGINPPNHYQCRSILIPIVEGEKFKLTQSKPSSEPAEGFRI